MFNPDYNNPHSGYFEKHIPEIMNITGATQQDINEANTGHEWTSSDASNWQHFMIAKDESWGVVIWYDGNGIEVDKLDDYDIQEIVQDYIE